MHTLVDSRNDHRDGPRDILTSHVLLGCYNSGRMIMEMLDICPRHVVHIRLLSVLLEYDLNQLYLTRIVELCHCRGSTVPITQLIKNTSVFLVELANRGNGIKQ